MKDGINLRKRLLNLGFIVFFLLFTSYSHAKSIFDFGTLYFDTVGDEESLALCCTAVRQDQKGFIWIGTQKGLVRYDGYRFTRFLHSKDDPYSITGNIILSIWEAEDGRLWIGTATSGLSVYDPVTNQFTNYRHDPNDPNSLSHNRIYAISGDKAGNIWIVTKSGLDSLNLSTERFEHRLVNNKLSSGSKKQLIRTLMIDKNNTLWVGDNLGVLKFLVDEQRFERITAKEQNDVKSVSGTSGLFQSLDGKIWVGTNNGEIYWIDPANDTKHKTSPLPLPKNKPHFSAMRAISQPTENEIWFGSFGDGIFIIDSKTGQLHKRVVHDNAISSSINFDTIASLWTDKSGLVWIATWGGGLNLYNSKNKAIRTLHDSPNRPISLTPEDVSAILELKDGSIWIGSHGHGINVIDLKKETVKSFLPDGKNNNVISNGFVTSIAQTKDGNVWVGTRDGLNRYDLTQQKLTPYTSSDGLVDNYIRTLLATKDGNLLIASDRGLVRYNASSGKIENWITVDPVYEKMASETISFLAIQENGDLWIATTNGLFLLSNNRKKLRRFIPTADRTNSLSDHLISGLLVDKNDTLWIDTASGLDQLINLSEDSARFKSISRLTGNFGLSIGSNMLEDNFGRIWTQSSIINPQDFSQIPLNRSNGIDFGTFWAKSYAKTIDGTFLFGGSKGLLIIEPEMFKKWIYQPNILLSEVKIDGKPQFDFTKKLFLSSTTKSFSVIFSNSDFSSSDKNRYAYYLEGYDYDWIEVDADHRNINYTNLDPGVYILRLRSSNRLGDWSSSDLELTIEQEAAWFQTLWFKLIIVLVIMLIVFSFVKFRLRTLKLQKRLLMKQVKQRTIQLKDKNIELEKALVSIEQVSFTDQLTKAYNRRFLKRFIEKELAKVTLDGFPEQDSNYSESVFSFLVIDIDYFKQVNDTYGHSSGDLVLQQFVKILHQTCRESDWVIRWGGEEFLIVARHIKRNELNDLSERIRINIEKHEFNIGNQQTLNKTCSIGSVSFPFIKDKVEALSWEQTLNLADVAMYFAKNNGRNNWVSLVEKEIDDPKEFYKSIISDLPGEIEKGSVIIESSAIITKTHIN